MNKNLSPYRIDFQRDADRSKCSALAKERMFPKTLFGPLSLEDEVAEVVDVVLIYTHQNQCVRVGIHRAVGFNGQS